MARDERNISTWSPATGRTTSARREESWGTWVNPNHEEERPTPLNEYFFQRFDHDPREAPWSAPFFNDERGRGGGSDMTSDMSFSNRNATSATSHSTPGGDSNCSVPMDEYKPQRDARGRPIRVTPEPLRVVTPHELLRNDAYWGDPARTMQHGISASGASADAMSVADAMRDFLAPLGSDSEFNAMPQKYNKVPDSGQGSGTPVNADGDGGSRSHPSRDPRPPHKRPRKT